MTTVSCQWLGHTNLLFQSSLGPVLFQPFFRRKLWFWQRASDATVDATALSHVHHIFLASPHFDRLDLNALKYFYQHNSTLYLAPKIAKEVRKFFHFQNLELHDQQEILCGDLKIKALATQTRCLRYGHWHRERFDFLVESGERRVLILSDLPQDGTVWESFANLGKANAVFVPIEKLCRLKFWQKSAPQTANLRRLVDFLQIEKIFPYAYGDYARNADQPSSTVEAFRHQLSHLGLADKTVWLSRGQNLTL